MIVGLNEDAVLGGYCKASAATVPLRRREHRNRLQTFELDVVSRP